MTERKSLRPNGTVEWLRAPCPRCHQQCGWCGDYRWMHGTIKLPGSKKRCDMPGLEPESDGCALCGGSRRVFVNQTFKPAPAEQDR